MKLLSRIFSKTILLVLVGALVTIPSQGADRRTDKNQLVVMTYNGEFLWDGRSPEEGQVNFAWKGDPAKADAHMALVADVIKQSDPDIVNMVEVESLAALQHFNQAHLAGMGYVAYLTKGKDTFTGQDVGILTKIDPEGGAVHRDARKGKYGTIEKSVSKNQYAKFIVGSDKIALVGVHYLSRPTDTARISQRNAQASATHTVVSELQAQGYEIILTGDFNDYAYTVDDIQANKPISIVLKSLSEMGQGSADDLTNVLAYVPPSSRYTSHYDKDRDGKIDGRKELSAIDHMLVSKGLVKYMTDVDIDHSLDPTKVSDHYPIIATFSLNAY